MLPVVSFLESMVKKCHLIGWHWWRFKTELVLCGKSQFFCLDVIDDFVDSADAHSACLGNVTN
jgi:hypothetical protein